MKIIFLTHYFFPEGNAPAVRVYEMARRWVRAGHEVTVITGVPNVPNGILYTGYRNRPRWEETIDGIRVVRVWTYLAPNRGTIRRTLNYLSFMLSSKSAACRIGEADVLIATSPQFFCAWAGMKAAKRLKLPFVLEIRDIWPESIRAVGAIRSNAAIRVLERMEKHLYAAADRIVTVGDGYREQLVARGASPDKITVIPNGVDVSMFSPRAASDELLTRYNLNGRFVCSYVGTVGMACGLDVVLRAADILRKRGIEDVRFLIAGDGAERERLEADSRRLGLQSVVFTGRLPREQVPGILAASNACLVHLRKKELFKTVLPSKIFEAASMQKPIILGVEGDAAKLVTEAAAGICIEPENAEQLVDALLKLRDDPGLAALMGRAGYERICPDHDYAKLAGEYEAVLEGTVRQK